MEKSPVEAIYKTAKQFLYIKAKEKNGISPIPKWVGKRNTGLP